MYYLQIIACNLIYDILIYLIYAYILNQALNKTLKGEG